MNQRVLTTEALPLRSATSSNSHSGYGAVLPTEPSAMQEEEEDGDLDRELERARGAAPSLSASNAARIKSLVVDHHAFVWRSLVRLGVPRADAEDALQQVFMVTARKIDDVAVGSERAFLYGVSMRVASRTRRTHARRREVVGDDACPERVDTADSADEMLDRARAKQLLEEILALMPLDLRSVFTLFELEQMTMIQIAALLDVPQGTVASRLRRAREVFTEHSKRIELKSRRTKLPGGAES